MMPAIAISGAGLAVPAMLAFLIATVCSLMSRTCPSGEGGNAAKATWPNELQWLV
jgi:hypothetical protein